MDIGVISVRYARALLKAAVAAKQEDKVYIEMQTLAKSYIDVAGLRRAIDNPMLAKDKKNALLLTACGKGSKDSKGGLTKLTEDFLKLVLREDRESMVQFMANSYVTLYRQLKNIIRGKLTTAVAVSSSTQKKMRQMVEAKTKGSVEFETEVEPEIIGGFILEYDTFRLDASIRSQLRGVLNQLKA